MVKIKCPETGEIVEAEQCEPFLKKYPPVIRKVLIKDKKARRPREGKPNFGVGRLVKECMRQSYYDMVEEVVHSPEKLWIFERGHAIHNHIQKQMAKDEQEIFVKAEFPLFNVIGFIDGLQDGVLYEFKTTADIPVEPQTHHVLQAQGYYSMLSPEQQAKIDKILIVYISLKEIKTFEVPKRNILSYLESKGVILAKALETGISPNPTESWLCKYCDFKDKCEKASKPEKPKSIFDF